MAAYRIVSEAVTNVVRHAHADACQVAVTHRGADLVVSVRDNGQGLRAVPSSAGHGLSTMRERAEELGGTLSIVEDDGVVVTAVLPLWGHREETMITVLVVDDHPMFRDGLTGLLATVEDCEVVGAAASGEEAVELAERLRPEVVLMDLNLGGISGIEATRRVLAAHPTCAVLAVTMVDDDDTVVAALRAGARGYVLKGATGQEIVGAVRGVAAGGVVIGRGVAATVLAMTTGRPRTAEDGLTDREREILELIADGAGNAQIARSLGLSLKTVQNYVTRILDKLHVTDRTQAALRARDARH